MGAQFAELAILAIAVACVSWTVTHEEVFREPREWCVRRSRACRTLYARKFYYLFTCEYCFSHYVAALFVWITGYRLLFDDWRGYAIAVFALVWIANLYMSAYGRLRLDLRRERIELENVEHAGVDDRYANRSRPDGPRKLSGSARSRFKSAQ